MRRHTWQKGFGLIEVLVATAVFVLVGIAIYETYFNLTAAVQASHVKLAALALANEQFEIARNLPYNQVGIDGGLPVGALPSFQTLVRDNTTFEVRTIVRNIDDPFDGTIGGTPNDTAPADYKLVEVEVSCPLCANFTPMTFTTRVAPKNLELTSNNGALFIRVFDASGVPVQNADVHVENTSVTPAITIDDVTDANGELKLIDVPPGSNVYEVTVSKTGYTTDRTYVPGGAGNPNPSKPHASVVEGAVTQISLVVDLVSTIEVSSITESCSSVAGFDFGLAGSALIGTSPDVLNYYAAHQTDAGGEKTIATMRWDTYVASGTDASFHLSGSIPLLPLALTPGATQDLLFTLQPKVPEALLVTVRDAGTSLPLTDVSVRLEGPSSFDDTKITGRGYRTQTDWSGGSEQANYLDATQYFSQDGYIDVASPVGELKLTEVLGDYDTSGSLISSTFDTGAPSNFYQLSWLPLSQPPDTGADSVRFQLATNNDNATWNFLGPDGTSGTYYTTADSNISAAHTGDRYFRYQIFLGTASTTYTPNISDVSFTNSSSCIPPGQVFWSGLAAGTYTVTISKAGYQDFVDDTAVGNGWQEFQVSMQPE